MSNAPIKYFGGKGNMFNDIIKYFPKPDTYNTYIEPFGGSYSIGLRLNPVPPNEVYNDLEQNVYSLYKVISDNELFVKFKEKCDLFPYSEDFREEFRGKLKEELDILDRAFYYFYVNRTSHNGVGGFSMNLIPRRNMSKSVSDYLSSVDRLEVLHQRLSKIIITNKDGIELIKKYDKPEVLFYHDPPYHHSTRTSARYKVDMTNDKQKEFIDTIISCKNSKHIISGYNCEEYSVLESNGFKRIDFIVNTVDGNKNPKTKTESLWLNYET
jgi:DNA adenine methylase